jgi:hypothetical protein
MSPMMEGIESCIDYIDEKVIEDLTPKLLQLIRKGIGLPTKVFVINFNENKFIFINNLFKIFHLNNNRLVVRDF